MAGKKGENTKKAAGNAKKAEVANAKASEQNRKQEQAEAKEWSKGARDDSKKAAAADKAAEAARKKAEKEAQLKEEEANQPSKPKGEGKKTAQKKAPASKGLDLGQLEGEETKRGALNATGIENAIDALGLTSSSGANDKIDKHPERRFKAAYAAYEERRLDEMKDERGLRRQQKIDQIRKEFEKSPDNPFNQGLVGRFDMTKEEARELREQKRDETEARLERS